MVLLNTVLALQRKNSTDFRACNASNIASLFIICFFFTT